MSVPVVERGDTWMLNPPPGADVQYWPGYGFVAPSLTTTNGSLRVLLSRLHPRDCQAVLDFAEFVLGSVEWHKTLRTETTCVEVTKAQHKP